MEDRLSIIRIKKIVYALVLVPLLSFTPINALFTTHFPFSRSTAAAAASVEIWWPQNGSTHKGTVPFKAVLSGQNIEQYELYWQVDGGALVSMENSLQDHPHKEYQVHLDGWTWKGAGPYQVTFVAKDLQGNRISEKTISISNGSATAAPTLTGAAPSPAPAPAPSATISVWWPAANATLTGTQQLKAVVDNRPIDQYRLFYSIDGGVKAELPTSMIEYPHKELSVNTASWGGGTHVITFSATDLAGTALGQKEISVTTPYGSTVPAPAPIPSPTISTNPFRNVSFYVNPYSNAKRQATLWQSTRPDDARQMNKIGDRPDAEWFGNWNSDIEGAIRTYQEKTATQHAVPVMVVYNIPNRDCGSYSAGGAASAEGYRSWIRGFARGIGDSKAIVILEPDALPGIGCLSAADQETRLALLKDAVEVLKAHANTAVYIDAGHSNWISADETARRLEKAGIARADGFSLNISNFIATDQNITFGTAVSNKIGGKHFIIDTSRNGNGSNGEWCNPSGRALGATPTAATGNSLVDAYFWIKKPGDSDGSCNGAPSAGSWMPEYALELARNTH